MEPTEPTIHTAAIIAVLAFYAIVFIQSGYDKIFDWKGNLGWLTGHFANTPIKNLVPAALFLLLCMEVVSGAASVIGIVKLLMGEGTDFAYLAGILSASSLLMLLLGQRMAKDYDGARTIAIYFIPAILLLTWV